MSENAHPVQDFVKAWWPTFTAIMVISGMMSSAITYYAKVEAKELIKVELIDPVKKIDNLTDKFNNQIHEMQTRQIQSETKIDMMLEMMRQQQQLQQKTLDEIKKDNP